MSNQSQVEATVTVKLFTDPGDGSPASLIQVHSNGQMSSEMALIRSICSLFEHLLNSFGNGAPLANKGS